MTMSAWPRNLQRYRQGLPPWPTRAMAVVARRTALAAWAPAALLGLLAFVLRAAYLNRSFDIFIDEITYLRIAQSVAHGLGISLYGQPFYLHPPAFFMLEAAYLKAVGPVGDTLRLIYAVRYLNVALAGLTAALLYLIVRRVAGWPAAVTAAALFALDPFIIRQNSLNLLDTSAILWVMCGYGVLVWGMDEHGLRYRPPGRQVLWEGTVGVFFGLALLTKDMMVFLTLLPLATCFVFNLSLPRAVTAFIGGVACFVYALYPAALIAPWGWGQLAAIKLHGVSRLIGAARETGFRHSGGGPSLLSTVVTRLDQFGTTYAIIALGLVAVAVLARWGDARHRLLALWVASAYALLGYCVAFGTLEEQFFYLLVVPALAALAAAGALLLNARQAPVPAAVRRALPRAIWALLAGFILWSGYRWGAIHLTPNDGFARVLAYVDRSIPAPQRHVAATEETAQFLLGDQSSGPWGLWDTPAALQAYHPAYVIVDPDQVIWDHGAQGRALLTWIAQHGRPVFALTENTPSSLALYEFSWSGGTRASSPTRGRARTIGPPAPPPIGGRTRTIGPPAPPATRGRLHTTSRPVHHRTTTRRHGSGRGRHPSSARAPHGHGRANHRRFAAAVGREGKNVWNGLWSCRTGPLLGARRSACHHRSPLSQRLSRLISILPPLMPRARPATLAITEKSARI